MGRKGYTMAQVTAGQELYPWLDCHKVGTIGLPRQQERKAAPVVESGL